MVGGIAGSEGYVPTNVQQRAHAQMGNAVAVSTDRLRQRLLEEGLTEAAIQDSEQIMKSEFSALRNHLLLLKQKQLLLLDTLRHLEVRTRTLKLLCFVLQLQFVFALPS